MMSRLDADTETTVRRFLERIQRSYDVAGAIVFGSRVRGTHHVDSDVDVAVLLRGDAAPFLDIKLAMADVAYNVFLELDTDIIVSPLPISMEQWEHPEDHFNPALLQNIAREGIWLLYQPRWPFGHA